MKLFPFQETASSQIASRFSSYANNPLMIDRLTPIPFFQSLISITGSGKTLILADTVAQIQAALPCQPIVLWLSKGRVVVWQTYTNLSSGKYADNIPGFDVKPLHELAPYDIEDEAKPILLVATVGKFARRNEEEGDRRIFRVQLDLASESLWDLLKRRRTPNGVRRPLIVVYDEGHNLSDLQSHRLLELAPDALIAASATMAIPQRLENVIRRLREDRSWSDNEFTTSVASKEVVKHGLVKRQISIGGYVAPMETAISSLLADMADAQDAAATLEEPFRPKAIYVCTTNTVDGVPVSEDVKRPFVNRQARPIQIWRYLVETAGIEPEQIAVYCQLKFTKEFPPPPNFRLFSGGDKDFDGFLQGNFEHIIFNLSLQEGWDDPLCGFAYIDKEMASTRQITQVIGRVLRQPKAQHFSDPVLNTAHFYVRTDERGIFDDILDDIRRELISEHPAIALTIRKDGSSSERYRAKPSRPRTVPIASIYSNNAIRPVRKIVDGMMDFRNDSENTVGRGSRMQVLHEVGSGADASYDWVEIEHSNRVTARSIFRRELQRLYSGSLRRTGGPINLVDIEAPKFDAMIEISSPAAEHVRETASHVVDAFIGHSCIFQNEDDVPYAVGPISVDPDTSQRFSHALHEHYSGLNGFELEIARAINQTQRIWCRNPEGSGYFIPLLDHGSTATFWPDFLVWIDRYVIALDTKGSHLIAEDSRRKLFDIETTNGRSRIVVRLISKGTGSISSSGQVSIKGNKGYTIWKWANGRLTAIICNDEKSAVDAALSI